MKSLEVLKESASHVARVAMLLDGSNPNQIMYSVEQDAEASALGLELRRSDVRSP